MAWKTDDWAKPRSNGTPFTEEERAFVKAGFEAKRSPRDVARDLQSSSRTVARHFVRLRRHAEIEAAKAARAASTDKFDPVKAREARFYRSSFEL